MLPMPFARVRANLSTVILSVLALLLVLVGALLYRGINRVSQADRQKQKEFLETAMQSFKGEFSGTVLEILSTFRPVPWVQTEREVEPYFADLYLQWRSTSPQAQLVGTVSIGTIAQDGAITFRHFQPEEVKFEEQEWPPSLASFRNILSLSLQTGDARPRVPPAGNRGFPRLSSRRERSFIERRRYGFALSKDRPVIVLPLMTMPNPRRMPTRGVDSGSSSSGLPAPFSAPGMLPSLQPPAASGGPTPPIQLVGWCFLELDLDFLQQHFLPALVERHFGGPGMSGYRLAVITGSPRRVLYRTDPKLTAAALSSVDATLTLFSARSRSGPAFRLFGGPAPATLADAQEVDSNSADTWLLVAKHESGSLDSAIDAERRRNLAVGFGVLLLLAGSMSLLVLTTQRARALARRQMEFVAGITHELRTPLAVIQSAGFNLSKGLVEDSDRTQQYGTMIQKESRRLSDMIEQILSYAGIQSGRRQYEFKPTQIPELVTRALAAYSAAFQEAGWQVQTHIGENLPPVLADAQSLESTIKNLFANALRYASQGKWLRISVQATRSQKETEVQVTVEDRGPGIDPGDLPHIFDPFYRGQKLVGSSIPGAGLGLSLVHRHLKAHGGRVTFKTSQGKGAAFTLHLPALSPAGGGETA